MPDFSAMPEVFVSDAGLAAAVSREVKRGALRKLSSRVYTCNLKDPLELDFAQRYTAAVDFADLPIPEIVADAAPM
jgi:hypothetical protein